MQLHDLLVAAILGLIEGVTEFIPVSSTGHLILAQNWLDFTGAKATAFVIFIQLGAILAVVWLYRRKFWTLATSATSDSNARRLIVSLAVATLPAVVIGLPTEDWIEKHLFKPLPVAIAFVVGGVAILFVEWLRKPASVATVDDIPIGKALGVGLFQVLAILFPGTSRSGATIMGGLVLGLSRTAAAEFSFFLAIPAMMGASIIKLYKVRHELASSDAPMFAIGFAVAFLSALAVIKLLLAYVGRRSFAPFAWYRIVFGGLLLAANALGFVRFPSDWGPSDPRCAPIESRYDLTVSATRLVFPVRVTGGKIDGAGASPQEIDRYAPLLVAEFSRYPACLVEQAGLKRIVLCRDLSFAGQLRSALPDFQHDTLYLDVRRAADNRRYLRKVLHHEFFHMIDWRDDGQLYEDVAWSRLNDPSFAYGAGGETAQDNAATSVLSDDYPGFLNHYSTTSVAEDKAEIFAHLLVEPEAVARKAKEDSVLRAKVRLLKEQLVAICPEMRKTEFIPFKPPGTE